MAELWIALFAVACLTTSAVWVGFAVARWRHMAFTNVLLTLQRIGRIQEPNCVSTKLRDAGELSLSRVTGDETAPEVSFSAGVASANFLLRRAGERIPQMGFIGYCSLLVVRTAYVDLIAARRLSAQLGEFPESLVPVLDSFGSEAGRFQRAHRLRQFAESLWRFNRLASHILQVPLSDEALELGTEGLT